jgi:endonuclease YncB( thermonuclease family)
VTLGQQEADTVGEEDTLLHGETLLVVTSGDAENVALELVAEGVARDLSRDALVVEDTTREAEQAKKKTG